MANTTKIVSGGWLEGKKTYITAGIGILTAIGAYLTGEMDIASAVQTVFPLLGLIFVRKAIK